MTLFFLENPSQSGESYKRLEEAIESIQEKIKHLGLKDEQLEQLIGSLQSGSGLSSEELERLKSELLASLASASEDLEEEITQLREHTENEIQRLNELINESRTKKIKLETPEHINSRFFENGAFVNIVDMDGITFVEAELKLQISTLTSNGGVVFTIPSEIRKPAIPKEVRFGVRGTYRNNQGSVATDVEWFDATVRTDGVISVNRQVIKPQNDSSFGSPKVYASFSYINGI
ncbi:TPA: hypothetical protein ACPJ1A_004521 [Vibrio diabolicus]